MKGHPILHKMNIPDILIELNNNGMKELANENFKECHRLLHGAERLIRVVGESTENLHVDDRRKL
jgi:predicted dienelactone hydrolase